MENENIPIEKFTLSAQHQHFDLLKDSAAIAGIPAIPTEMPIEEFELLLSIRQHYHELREAFDCGYNCIIPQDDGWDVFIGDYGKKEMSVPVPIFDSQLRELCAALGWQGGTYHGVLAEIKRLKTFESNAKDPRQGDHC